MFGCRSLCIILISIACLLLELSFNCDRCRHFMAKARFDWSLTSSTSPKEPLPRRPLITYLPLRTFSPRVLFVQVRLLVKVAGSTSSCLKKLELGVPPRDTGALRGSFICAKAEGVEHCMSRNVPLCITLLGVDAKLLFPQPLSPALTGDSGVCAGAESGAVPISLVFRDQPPPQL